MSDSFDKNFHQIVGSKLIELGFEQIKLQGCMCPEYLFYKGPLWFSLSWDWRDQYLDVSLGKLFWFKDVMRRVVVIGDYSSYDHQISSKAMSNLGSDIAVFKVIANSLDNAVAIYDNCYAKIFEVFRVSRNKANRVNIDDYIGKEVVLSDLNKFKAQQTDKLTWLTGTIPRMRRRNPRMHAIALYRGVIPYRDLMFKKALLILLICSPIHSYSSDMNCENFHFGELCRVSIINLIASPEKYDGKFVEVDGYYRYEFEVSGLFLTQEHSIASSFSNSIWISFGDTELDHFNCKLPENADLCNQLLQPKDASGQFVGVIGKFSKSDRGHRGIFQGSINQVQGFFKK